MSEPSALAGVVARGGVALIGVDTVYGLCCDAQNRAAAARIVELKGRAAAKPTAVAFFSLQAVLDALPELGERTRAAVSALLPGPLTLLLPNPSDRFPLAGGGRLLGVRVVDPTLDAGRPVLLTSANLAGDPEARTLAEVPAEIRDGVDLELDCGVLPGTPSTVIDLGELETDGRWRIVRAGAVAASAVELALVGSW
ncbi:MAG: Sua5/YciO/YrdC/YwlC family protein [Solirubrobacteraceae bacterium]|jgi:L-threonylcarbamoyladenylate synthase